MLWLSFSEPVVEPLGTTMVPTSLILLLKSAALTLVPPVASLSDQYTLVPVARPVVTIEEEMVCPSGATVREGVILQVAIAIPVTRADQKGTRGGISFPMCSTYAPHPAPQRFNNWGGRK